MLLLESAIAQACAVCSPKSRSMSDVVILRHLQILSNCRGADDPRTSANHLVASHLVDA
jgi:hypothetical protein